MNNFYWYHTFLFLNKLVFALSTVEVNSNCYLKIIASLYTVVLNEFITEKMLKGCEGITEDVK